MAALKKHCPLSHFEKVKRDNGVFDYCQKTETRVAGPFEFGIKPVRVNNKLDLKERNEKIISLGAKASVDEGLVRIESI